MTGAPGGTAAPEFICLHGCRFSGDVTEHLKAAHHDEWQRRVEMEDRVQIYRGADETWYWRRISPDGSTVSRSMEGVDSSADAVVDARRVNARPYILEVAASRDDTLVTDTSAGLTPQPAAGD